MTDRVYILCFLCAIFWHTNSVDSSIDYVKFRHEMRTLQFFVDIHIRNGNGMPENDQYGTWIRNVDYTTSLTGIIDLHYLDQMNTQEVIDPVFLSPVCVVNGRVRAFGENHVDDGGEGDDWDVRYGPNDGYWYKADWPWHRFWVLIFWGCGALFIPAASFMLMKIFYFGLLRSVCLATIGISYIYSCVLLYGEPVGLFRNGSLEYPRWVDLSLYASLSLILACTWCYNKSTGVLFTVMLICTYVQGLWNFIVPLVVLCLITLHFLELKGGRSSTVIG